MRSLKQRNRLAWRLLSFFTLLSLSAVAGLLGFVDPGAATRVPPSRHLLTLTEAEKELMSEEQIRNGGVTLHIIGVVYIFIALALVCDEYFVPALDVIVERLGVTPDVAGATFMAAGGSAPELFTSLIGTFQESDVGFGTIVGSAVFNVLFVIGMCAIFSKEVLQLTWWPLFRDVIYYSISLLTLAFFFGYVSPYEIEWWEAAILFGLYVGYCFVMANNPRLFKWVHKTCLGKTILQEEGEEGEIAAGVLGEASAFLVPSMWRAGVLQTFLDPDTIEASASAHAIHLIEGDVKQTFKKLDADSSGSISITELKALLVSLDVPDANGDMLKALERRLDLNGDGQIQYKEFAAWYFASEARLSREIDDKFHEVDLNRDGSIDEAEFKTLLTSLRIKCDDRIVAQAVAQIKRFGSSRSLPQPLAAERLSQLGERFGNQAAKVVDPLTGPQDRKGAAGGRREVITKSEFTAWYKASQHWEWQRRRAEREAALRSGLSWCPESGSSACTYCKFYFVLPLAVAFYFTLPDVRNPKYCKYFPLTFCGAIVWIGIFSYFMVWWATTIGDVFNIPPAVMGLTFLAAGTSIPDLLTSVIVATQGEGDMAVSSSIGSNIFDVLVGLPVPWLLYAFYNQQPVQVKAESLVVSILVLFIMLALVVGTIALNKWRMTKQLGYTMFVLYALFVVQDLARTYGWLNQLLA
jgi:K+-dependent Na+/Ca+ exchanger-like protein